MHVSFAFNRKSQQLLTATSNVPKTWQKYILGNTKPLFYSTGNYSYLEQCYFTNKCSFVWLDMLAEEYPQVTFPQSDEPMVIIVFMLDGSVLGEMSNGQLVALLEGFGYMFYLPGKTT